MEVKFTRLAIADLTRIRDYIGTFNPQAADRMATQLLSVAFQLEDNPLIGRARADGTREMTIVPPYVVVYRIFDHYVRILRIWHGAQDRP